MRIKWELITKMHPSPDQFNRAQDIGGPSKKEVHKPCPHCKGSGKSPRPQQLTFPGMPEPRPKSPEDKYWKRKPDYTKVTTSGPHSPHLPPKGSEPRKEKDWQIKKNNRTAINPKDKDYIKRHRDDDDKNPPMSGGSKVPRKPKPGPKSPGTYRPIERETDPNYARKLDRYRVTARG